MKLTEAQIKKVNELFDEKSFKTTDFDSSGKRLRAINKLALTKIAYSSSVKDKLLKPTVMQLSDLDIERAANEHTKYIDDSTDYGVDLKSCAKNCFQAGAKAVRDGKITINK